MSHSWQSHQCTLHVALTTVGPRHTSCPTHYSPTQATHDAPFMSQLITVTLKQHVMDRKHQTLNVSAHYSHSPNTCWFVKADRMEEYNTPTHSFTMTLCNKQPDLLRNTSWCWTQLYHDMQAAAQHSFTMTLCNKQPNSALPWHFATSSPTQLYHDTLQQGDVPTAKTCHDVEHNTPAHSFTMTLCKKQTSLLQNTSWCWTPSHTALPWHFATSSPTFCETHRHEQSWHTIRCDKATPTDSPHLKQLL